VVSPNAISLVQMQAHGLLGDRGTQPLDLRASLLQLDLLAAAARPAGHRRGERIQRSLLRRAAHGHDSGAVHAEAVGRLSLGRLLGENLDEHLVLLAGRQPLAWLASRLGLCHLLPPER
jgi:hypothetical protein